VTTIELAKLAGLDTSNEDAIHAFATLVVDKELAKHVVMNHTKINARHAEMVHRQKLLESDIKGLRQMIGAFAAYVDHATSKPGFFNEFLKEHARKQRE
jgi:hypothetical protein